MDQFLSPHLTVASTRFRNPGGASISRGMYDGQLQAATLGGSRVACSLDFTPTKNRAEYAERSALIAQIIGLEGPVNPIWMADHAHTRRGSFATSELLTNNDFANSTTGWFSSDVNNLALSVTDRILRATRVGVDAIATIRRTAAATVVANAPYVFRAMMLQGRGLPSWSLRLGTTDGGSEVAIFTPGSTPGLQYVVGTPAGTSLYANISSGVSARSVGDFVEFPYTSLTRCMLVDNGLNLITRSSDFGNAAWAKTNATITGDAMADPWGGSSMDALVDNGTNGAHQVAQSAVIDAAVKDYSFGIALKKGAVDWGIIRLVDGAGSTLTCSFNLNTGVKGTLTTGANWANGQSFMHSLGNGLYFCCIVGSKNSSQTSLDARVLSATADNTLTYAGTSSAAIYMGRATLVQASHPTRLVSNTAAVTSASQTGSGLELRGLTASASGLLRFGDWIQLMHPLGSSLHMATASLDTDAAGRGFLPFAPRIRQPPVDGAPLIVHNPLGRFACVSDVPEWANDPGVITTASLEFEEV